MNSEDSPGNKTLQHLVMLANKLDEARGCHSEGEKRGDSESIRENGAWRKNTSGTAQS